jgi:DNA polymerase-3 subunit alpha
MDRILSISQQAHGAAEQYTMFDLPAFALTARLASDLPQVAEVPRREVLGWEKELVGAYISDHPLSRVWADLEGTVTVLTGQIDETMDGQNVTVAGLVNRVRNTLTKKGAPMAFAQIEDLQGTIEVVIFPGVWEQTKELWELERILIVRGRVSLRGREPSIIVNSVTDEITTTRVLEQQMPASSPVGAPTPVHAPPEAGLPDLVGEPSSLGVHLHVTVPRSDPTLGSNMEAVIRRLGRVYDLLRRYPGEDRFSLYVENGSQGRIQISFPNDTTGHCVELEQELRALVGAGMVRVERMEQATKGV